MTYVTTQKRKREKDRKNLIQLALSHANLSGPGKHGGSEIVEIKDPDEREMQQSVNSESNPVKATAI